MTNIDVEQITIYPSSEVRESLIPELNIADKRKKETSFTQLKEEFVPTLKGNHSDIYLGEFGNGEVYIKKVIGEKDNGYTVEEATQLASLIDRYYRKASEVNLPLPKLYQQFITKSEAFPDKVNIVQIQQFVGKDLQTILAQTFDPKPIIDGYLDCFDCVNKGNFEIALDANPKNFCQDSKGKITYVDVIPPRQILDDGSVIVAFPHRGEDPDLFFINRSFTIEGQVHNLYNHLLRALAYNENFHDANTPEMVRKILRNHFGDSVVKNLAENIEKLKKQEVIVPPDCDVLRSVACEEFYKGNIDREKLLKIFSLSFLEIEGKYPSQSSVDQAMEMLRDALMQ